MTGLIIAPDFDHPDEKDSREFQSQARMFISASGGMLCTFDNELPMTSRASQVLADLDTIPPNSLAYVATCCHGWRRGIQFGFDTRGKESPQSNGVMGLAPHFLADAIAKVGKTDGSLVIPLYSCSTAEDPVNGFAATLSRLLTERGVPHAMFAHTNAGHCTRNPYVRTFGKRTGWLVEPGSAFWGLWVQSLHSPHDTLVYDYPFLDPAELQTRLGA